MHLSELANADFRKRPLMPPIGMCVKIPHHWMKASGKISRRSEIPSLKEPPRGVGKLKEKGSFRSRATSDAGMKAKSCLRGFQKILLSETANGYADCTETECLRIFRRSEQKLLLIFLNFEADSLCFIK
jgi:hypothetical protein